MMTIDEAWPHAEEARDSWGGSEQMRLRLWNGLAPELRERVQIVTSRVRAIRPDVPRILWVHDLPGDPENEHLQHPFLRQRFEKIVFVSYWQFQQFQAAYGIRYEEAVILENGIEPIEFVPKSKDGPIRLIYHTTPHRGLRILVPVARILKEHYNRDLTLDVYSSFGVYGWQQRDEEYAPLFEEIKATDYMTYHGAQPNAVVREALQQAHIFAYPSIWLETSCLAAIEAMSAGCSVVVPNFGALPETVSLFGSVYHWQEDIDKHAYTFAQRTMSEIDNYWSAGTQQRLRSQVSYVNVAFNIDYALQRWTSLIEGTLTAFKQKQEKPNAIIPEVAGQSPVIGQACRIVPG